MGFAEDLYRISLLSTIRERSNEVARIVTSGFDNDEILSDIQEQAAGVYRRWIADAEEKVLAALKTGVNHAEA